MKFASIVLATLFSAQFLSQASLAESSRFKDTICPASDAIAKAYLELQLCPHPENYPFLRDRPQPEPGDDASDEATVSQTTAANPGYVIDRINQKGSNYEVKFHYVIEKKGSQRSVNDSIMFTTYSGRVKNFLSCAAQTEYPKYKVVRESCQP